MQRSYESQESSSYGGESMASIDEYLERVTRMQRMPSMISADYAEIPVAHKVFDKSPHPEFFNVNHHQHQVPSPSEVQHKKVHFVEHDTVVEVGRDGKREVREERTIDVEADGFIQQKHRNFNASTFKAY